MKGKLKINNIVVDPRDEKYILKVPEQGFSPERNKQVIENSIRKTEMFRARQWHNWEDKTRERANALASFFKYLETGKGGANPLGKYFSRKMRAYLRGEEIIAELRNRDSYYTANKHGQIIRYAETQ
jgi:hypothetical protein